MQPSPSGHECSRQSQSWVNLFGQEKGRSIELERLLAAVEFAAEKHQFQTRKDPEKTPYIIHPLGVAQFTLDLGGLKDTDALIAALLHDTLEDTDTTPEEVEQLFGPHVLALVLDLTNPADLKGDACKMAQITHAPDMIEEAKIIKLADRYYNVCDLENVVWNQKSIDAYILWGAKLNQVLRGTSPKLERAIDDKVTEHFQSRFPSGVELGQLGDKWEFLSDHLPIGANIDGIEMATWNVLNTAYLSWVEVHNTQGLKGSQISMTNQMIDEETGLTLRDKLVVDQVIDMINHPSHPKQLISLQECGAAFLQVLRDRLPEHMAIVYTQEEPLPKNQDVVVYDTRHLTYREDLSSIDFPYECDPTRPVMNLAFEKNGKLYRVVNGHLPGDPTLPGRDEFAAYINLMDDDVVVAMGDMNFTREEMQKAFLSQGQENVPFSLISPYPTNVSLSLRSKTIDHIYVKGTFEWQMRYPEEVFEGLTPTVDLLTH
ncbi:HD domain-containing protein [Simkania sp.]|uniref:HD domain-containing protein n=1 Tax=Simkania sp. TaxID=34094 RepID=UPI003B52725C